MREKERFLWKVFIDEEENSEYNRWVWRCTQEAEETALENE